MFKITEVLIEQFYKNSKFYVDMGGYKVEAVASLPEEFNHEKLFEFSFTDKKVFNVNFSMEVKTFLPIFNDKSAIFVGNRIEKFLYSIDDFDKAPVNGIHTNQGVNNLTAQVSEDGLRPRGPSENTIVVE